MTVLWDVLDRLGVPFRLTEAELVDQSVGVLEGRTRFVLKNPVKLVPFQSGPLATVLGFEAMYDGSRPPVLGWRSQLSVEPEPLGLNHLHEAVDALTELFGVESEPLLNRRNELSETWAYNWRFGPNQLVALFAQRITGGPFTVQLGIRPGYQRPPTAAERSAIGSLQVLWASDQPQRRRPPSLAWPTDLDPLPPRGIGLVEDGDIIALFDVDRIDLYPREWIHQVSHTRAGKPDRPGDPSDYSKVAVAFLPPGLELPEITISALKWASCGTIGEATLDDAAAAIAQAGYVVKTYT